MNSATLKTYLHKTFLGMRKTRKITKQKHGYVRGKWRRRGKIGFIPGRCPLKNGGGEEKVGFIPGRCPKKTGGAFDHAYIFWSQPSTRFLFGRGHTETRNWMIKNGGAPTISQHYVYLEKLKNGGGNVPVHIVA